MCVCGEFQIVTYEMHFWIHRFKIKVHCTRCTDHTRQPHLETHFSFILSTKCSCFPSNFFRSSGTTTYCWQSFFQESIGFDSISSIYALIRFELARMHKWLYYTSALWNAHCESIENCLNRKNHWAVNDSEHVDANRQIIRPTMDWIR